MAGISLNENRMSVTDNGNGVIGVLRQVGIAGIDFVQQRFHSLLLLTHSRYAKLESARKVSVIILVYIISIGNIENVGSFYRNPFNMIAILHAAALIRIDSVFGVGVVASAVAVGL